MNIKCYFLSIARAMPIPPPIHNAAMPFFPPILSNEWSKVTKILAPAKYKFII